MSESMYVHKAKCKFCGEPVQVIMPFVDYLKWQQGEYLQNCAPYLTPGEREFLISGVCEPCFDKTFPGW